MQKGWISRRGNESIERGCKPWSYWTDEELKNLFDANIDNIPIKIYNFLSGVDINFLRDVFLDSPSGTFPEGTYSPSEYHHVVNDAGFLDIAWFFEFTVPDFDNEDEALLELQEKYAKFTEYKNYMQGVRDYSDWSKALIVEELKKRGCADKFIKLVNGCSIDFLRGELLTKGDEKILKYRFEENCYDSNYVVKTLDAVNIEDDYESLKKARDTWRARVKAEKEQKAIEKAAKATANVDAPCMLCKAVYLSSSSPYRKRIKAIAIKKADRYYFKADDFHKNGWSMGENTFSFKEVLEVIEELPADFDYKAWQLTRD